MEGTPYSRGKLSSPGLWPSLGVLRRIQVPDVGSCPSGISATIRGRRLWQLNHRRGAFGVPTGHNEHPDPVMSGDAGVDYFNNDPVVHTWTYKLDKAA
jgi:hypothetical protein